VPNSAIMVFSGNSNPELVSEIASRLKLRCGRAVVGKFSDGEVMAEIQENVRGRDVYVIQSTSCPTNDNLMELLVLIDALTWASAARITAVMPYYGEAGSTSALRQGADYGAPGGQATCCCWYRSSADGGSACGSDSGFFRYSSG